MKKLVMISTLSSLLVLIPSVNNLTTSTVTHIHEKAEVQVQENDNFEYLQNYFSNKSENFKDTLKQDLLKSITIKNDIVNFNIKQLNQQLWDHKIIQIINSINYQEILQNQYNNKILFNTNQYLYNGNWLETKWYWFGFFVLHLGHTTINSFFDISNKENLLKIVTTTLLAIPKLWLIAVVLATLIVANLYILRSYDKGNGAWLRSAFYMPVPIAWGSD